MRLFSGPEEIYEELVEKSEDHWLLGLVAFAVIEEQRIEWMKRQEINNSSQPTPDEIRKWYEQQPEGVLLRARDTAEARLKDYSNEIVELLIEDQRKEVEQGILLNEIKEIKKFWPQFGVNLVGGLVSSLIFAALLTIVAFFVLNDSSPAEIGKELRHNSEAKSND